MQKIGVIGCGLMGSGIVKTLVKNDFEVFIYDVNENAVSDLRKIGALPQENAHEVVKKVEALILSLPSPSLVENILTDSLDGVLNIMKKDTFILDMSTNDVKTTKILHDKAKSYNLHFYDCPLSGGPEGARTGSLTIMVGGEPSFYKNILPILEVLGENIFYVGEKGTGQVAKLCNNMLVAGIISLGSQVLLTAEKSGLSKEKLHSILQTGSAQTKVMEVFGPNILKESYENMNFSLSNMVKDINLYEKLAEITNTSSETTKQICKLFDRAMEKEEEDLDATAVYQEIYKQTTVSNFN